MVCNLRLRLLPEPRRSIIQTSHETDAPLHLRCRDGRLLALVLLTRRPSDHSAGEFAILLQHQDGQRQQGSNGFRRVAMAAVFHGIQRCAHLRGGRFAEGREPRPLVRRSLAVNLAPLTIAVGWVGIHGLASSLMGLVGMGLWETGLPRRDGRTPWASYLSYQPVSRANSQGWPAGMAARICRTCSGAQ